MGNHLNGSGLYVFEVVLNMCKEVLCVFEISLRTGVYWPSGKNPGVHVLIQPSLFLKNKENMIDSHGM